MATLVLYIDSSNRDEYCTMATLVLYNDSSYKNEYCTIMGDAGTVK